MTNSRFTTWTFVICFLLSLVLVLHLLFGFITPVVMAMAIVSICSSVHVKILTKLGHRDYLAATISTTLVVLVILIPISLFMIALVQQGLVLVQATDKLTSTTDISGWMTSLRGYLESFNQYLGKFGVAISTERIINFTSHLSEAIGAWVYATIGLLAANLLSLTLNFVLTVALVFVFFVSGHRAHIFVMDLLPLPDNEKIRLVHRFRELASAVFLGNGLISIAEGVLGGLSFFAFQISGAILWGSVMTIAAFLPVIGSAIVVIPATLYLFLIGQTWQAIVFLLFNTVQLTVLETLVKPRFIGTKSQMHAILVFMSVLAGVQIYGFFGLFYGPLLVTVFLTLAEFYHDHYRNALIKG